MSSPRLTIFNNTDNHSTNISQKLQTFYEDKEFCDIILVAGIDNVKLQAHRILLSASSDYFLGMFRSRLMESKSDEVEIGAIDGATLKLLLDYMYTASIELRIETVESVLRAADFFQINALMVACCTFMSEQLDTSNCLGITLFAEQLSYTELYKRSARFTCTHFGKVCGEQEFLQLTLEQLCKFITRDDLRVYSEEKMFLGLVAWVEYNRENREQHLFSLLSHVRFCSLTPEFIIANRHLVCKSIECDELIRSWLQWHSSPESRSQFPIELITKPRETLLFVSGRWTNEFQFQTFNVELNKWSYEEWPRPLRNRRAYCMAVVNKKLIIAGGFVGDSLINCIECFDPQTNKWTDLPPTRLIQYTCKIADLNGDLFVVGSTDKLINCFSAEKYDFNTGEWKEMSPLFKIFVPAEPAVLDGVLYIDELYANWCCIECYDPVTNKWTTKTRKDLEKEDFDMTSVGEYLYVVGGRCADALTGTGERYHPITNTWTAIKPMNSSRSLLKCTSFNNRLVVCAGFDGNRTVNLVEEYNPDTDEWRSLPPLLPHEVESRTNRLLTM